MPAFRTDVGCQIAKIITAGEAEWRALAFERRRDFRADSGPHVFHFVVKVFGGRQQAGGGGREQTNHGNWGEAQNCKDKYRDKPTSDHRTNNNFRIEVPRNELEDFGPFHRIEMVEFRELPDSPIHRPARSRAQPSEQPRLFHADRRT